MPTIKENLTAMFAKVTAGTVTREEGAMLLNHLARENPAETAKELAALVESPPAGVFAKTILHTAALSRNKAFFDILVANLGSADEELSGLSAEELAKLRTAESKQVLVEHLNNGAYHIRRASASALLNFDDGPEILKKQILTHPEPLYRSNSAEVLIDAGKRGMDCLLDILNSDNPDAVASAAEALVRKAGDLADGYAARVFDALMNAGDRGSQPYGIIELLKVAASLGKKAKGYEGYVMAFSDHPSEGVRKEASKALSEIKAALQ